MLRQSLTYQLVSIAEDAIGQGAALFKWRFGFDVHELRVLRLIDDEPGVTFTALADKTKFERSATSRILTRLVKSGLVRRRIDDRDARQFRLFSTPKGRALRAQADPLSLELEALMLAPLSEAERQQFLGLLKRIADWVTGDFVGEMSRRSPSPERAKAARKATPRARASRAGGKAPPRT
jgi:DNA-binding MarR family transcriptional regulator